MDPVPSTQDQGGTTCSGLGLSYQSIISQENVPKTCPQAKMTEVFSQLRLPLPSLCQADKDYPKEW